MKILRLGDANIGIYSGLDNNSQTKESKMTIEEFRKTMAETEYIPAGSELHLAFHAFSQEALKLTAELNGRYHEPDEVRRLMSELTASEVDESFGMFPPFHTDCGKNTKIGRRVFINAGCQFQDQGGIEIGDDVLIGPQTQTIIATLNHDPDPEKRGGMIDSKASQNREQGVARRTRDNMPRRDDRRRCNRRRGRGRYERRAAAHHRRGRSRKGPQRNLKANSAIKEAAQAVGRPGPGGRHVPHCFMRTYGKSPQEKAVIRPAHLASVLGCNLFDMAEMYFCLKSVGSVCKVPAVRLKFLIKIWG